MDWIEIKCKEDVLPIIEEYKDDLDSIEEELKGFEGDESNHALHRSMHLGTKTYKTDRVLKFFSSKKIDLLLDKGFELRFNWVMLKINTKNNFWGEFNYYPQSNKMYAKNWKMWYKNSWQWIEKKLINTNRL